MQINCHRHIRIISEWNDFILDQCAVDQSSINQKRRLLSTAYWTGEEWQILVLEKNPRNSDSLTSEFHSRCKNSRISQFTLSASNVRYAMYNWTEELSESIKIPLIYFIFVSIRRKSAKWKDILMLSSATQALPVLRYDIWWRILEL